MGFLSKAWKGVKKAVKKVGRAIKKVGSKVWGGIKKGFGKVAGLFGKLGPLGSIALSFAMPGIGSMLGGMWTSMAGSLASGQFGTVLQAVGKGMEFAATAASKAKGFILDGASPITSKIRAATEWVGGKITDGANYLVQGAQKAVTGTSDPMSIGDLGKVVADKAKGVYKSITGTTPAATTKGTTGFLTDNRIYDPNSPLGVSDLVGKPKTPLSLSNQPMNVQSTIAPQHGISPTVIDAAEQANISPFSTEAGDVAKKGIIGSGIQSPTLSNTTPDIIYPETEKAASDSLLEKIAKAAKSGLGGMSGSLASAVPQYSAPEVPALAGYNRMGVGAQGASGGNFLSDAQRQQQALFAQILGQVG